MANPVAARALVTTMTIAAGTAVCSPPMLTNGETAAASPNCAAPSAADAVPAARGAKG